MLTAPIKQFPAVIGEFRLLQCLGGGWTSDVFKAELVDPTSDKGKVFAIKIAADKSQTCDMRRDAWKRHGLNAKRLHDFFEREKRVLKACGQHPHIVTPLLELCNPALAGGHDIIATELACCTAELLFDKTASKGGVLPMDCIRYIAAQAASACSFLHAEGFTWLDPRLANIVITKNFSCKLIDFSMDWDHPKERDSLYFGAFLLYSPATGAECPMDPTLEDATCYKMTLRERKDLPGAFVDFASLLLDGHAFEAMLRHRWLLEDCHDETSSNATMFEGQQRAWQSLSREVKDRLMAAGIGVFVTESVTQ